MPDLPSPSPAPLPASTEPDSFGPPQPLCVSAALAEKGRAVGFDLLLWRGAARGFALRFDGRVVAYVNRCAHVPAELDWQPGEFLDDERRWILCSIHGAAYEPRSGHCVGGPCGRGRLITIATEERDGQVYWYPSQDIQPVGNAVRPGPVDPQEGPR